jgi:hypothetical protein
MKNPSSFNLKTATDQWRSRLVAHQSITPDNVRELESHLRESIADWTTKGASEEEAFYLASCRVGPLEKVAGEFEKEDPLAAWRVRAFWMLIGIMSLRFLNDLANTVGAVCSALALKLEIAKLEEVPELATNDPFGVFSGVQLAAFALAPLLLFLLSKRFHSPKGQPWKRTFAWFAASKMRLGLCAAALLFSATLMENWATNWRSETIHSDVITMTGLENIIEPRSSNGSTVQTSIGYSLLLILLLIKVAPASSANPSRIPKAT